MIVRHGESRWNLSNRFTGWVDVPLSSKGIIEAQKAARVLEGLTIHKAFTSELERAQETLMLILARQNYTGIFLHESKKRHQWAKHKEDKKEIPIHSSDALNERYYGSLQGMDKDAVRKKYGEEKVFSWRRSWTGKPPGGESLKDCYKRSVKYFIKKVRPCVGSENILLVAHGNSLRAIVKYIENISDEDIPHLNLPTGMPIVYKCIKGKLVRLKGDISFDRPLCWKNVCKTPVKRNV